MRKVKNKKSDMSKRGKYMHRFMAVLLAVVFVLQPLYVHAEDFLEDTQSIQLQSEETADTAENAEGKEAMDTAGDVQDEASTDTVQDAQAETADTEASEQEQSSTSESETLPDMSEPTESESETGEGAEAYYAPSDGSFGGEMLNFVNLYWETDDIGEVEAVFDGGSNEASVVTMNRSDRGLYSVQIPDGDYSRVGFRMAGLEALLGETAYNLYGIEDTTGRDVPTEAVDFAGIYCNTFYYDMGENPSYWGQDPQDASESMVSTYADSTWKPGDDYEVTVQKGDMVYMADLEKLEGQSTGTGRVNIAFLKKGHAPTPVMGTDGEAYTMYERLKGVYSAPFPEKVDEYSEIAFQLVGRDEVGTGGYLERHYNFRGGVTTRPDELWGYFKYKPGYADTFYLNLVSENNVTKDASYWSCHPSMANEALDTQVLYVDVTDYTANGTVVDIDNLWLRWEGMKDGLIEGAEYDAKKGYKMSKKLAQENYIYFQFPYNSGAAEQSVLTLSFTLKTDGQSDSTGQLYEYKFTFVPRRGKNCIQLDNIWEFNGQMWKHFQVDETVEKKTVFFRNKMTEYEKIYARISQEGKTYPTREELKSAGFSDEQLQDIDGNCWIVLQKVDEPNEYSKTNLYQLELPSTYKYIQFGGEKNGQYYTSDVEEISTKFSYPCYYANHIEAHQPQITGFWRSVYSADTTGDEMQVIPDGNFIREEGTYYTNTTFYDYYTTWEMSGIPLKDLPSKDHSEYICQGGTFNNAAEQYYKDAMNNKEDVNFKALYLTGDENTSQYKWQGNKGQNLWTGIDGGPVLGLAGDKLQDGMITTGNFNVAMPFFNEKFLRGDNILETAVGNVYKNVQFPFTKDTNPTSRTYGYWVFNSAHAEDAVRLSYDVDYGYFLERTKEPIKFRNRYSFFPYNDDSVSQPYYDGTDPYKQNINTLFGVQFEFDFKLTDNAEIYNEYTGKDEPIRFEFQGDDDAWIYIDDVLALDLGGIHDAVRGEINFKDGTYTIWKGLKRIDDNSYDGDGTLVVTDKLPEAVRTALKEKSSHKLKMFYMERCLYESNLKLSFNFPRESDFTVEKTVDITSRQTQGKENIFTNLLQNMGGFNFKIQNLVTSGKELAVEQSAGYLIPGGSKLLYNSSDKSAEFSFTDGEGTVTGDWPKVIVQHSAVAGAEPEEETLLKITPKSSLDLRKMSYLRLAMKNTGANDESAMNLYLSFQDTEGRRVGGYANMLGYEGESNSFITNDSSILRIDFRKMSGRDGIDWSRIRHMFIGVRRTTPEVSASYEVSSIAFLETLNKVPTGGFSVTDEQISDYGSYASGKLTPVDKAWYVRKNKNESGVYDGGISRQTDNGQFMLADGQKAVFTDKFRAGSYIALEETNVNPKIFDTEWTIREDGKEINSNYLLASRDDVLSVKNPLEVTTKDYPLSNVSGAVISDGRVENISSDWPNFDKIEVPDPSKTIVYRSYIDPDSTSNVSTDLSVAVKNTLKYGSLTIEKVMDSESGEHLPSDYTFDIYYVNIAGMGLEAQLSPNNHNNRYVRQTVTVHVDKSGSGSVTVDNIPAGTTYYVVERPSNGTKLVGIDIHKQEETLHENVSIGGVKAEQIQEGMASGDLSGAYVTGTAYASNKKLTFTNKREPFYMDIKKVWNDGLTDEERAKLGIKEIHIRLQRRIYSGTPAAESDWETVTKDYFDHQFVNDDGYIKLTAPDWKMTSVTALPFGEAGKVYEYRIQEIDRDGILKNYDVSYDEIRNPDLEVAENGEKKTYLYVTYQAVNTLSGVNVVKFWEDNDNVGGIRPKKIRVKLVGSVNKEASDWQCYKKLIEPNHQCSESCYIELTEDRAWRMAVKNLALKDVDNKPYYYKLSGEQICRISQNGLEEWVDAEQAGTISGYHVTYGEPQRPQGENAVMISATNRVDFGNITIEKFDKDKKNRLEGAEFKLERLIEEENTDKASWKVDQTFSPRTEVTSATGTIEFKRLAYGTYRITETKAPDGYVPLKKPIEVTLDDDAFASQAQQHEGDFSYDASKKLITVTVLNVKSLTIPGTGGGGKLWFTIVGGLLCGGAALLYINKRRSLRRTHQRRKR